MDIRLGKVFGAGFMLATLMASFAAFSQDDRTGLAADRIPEDDAPEIDRVTEIDALEPGIDTSPSSTVATDEQPAAAEASAVVAQNAARASVNPAAMDTIALSATEITGNQELPTVLVIVPWQKAQPGDIVGKPANTLLDEVLAPIDREEFVRQVNYYGDVYGEGER